MRTTLKLTCILTCAIAVTGCRSGGSQYVTLDRHPAERTIARQKLQLEPFRIVAPEQVRRNAESQLAEQSPSNGTEKQADSSILTVSAPTAIRRASVAVQPEAPAVDDLDFTSWPPLPTVESTVTQAIGETAPPQVAEEMDAPAAACISIEEWLQGSPSSIITRCAMTSSVPFDDSHVDELQAVQAEISESRNPDFAVPLLTTPAIQ